MIGGLMMIGILLTPSFLGLVKGWGCECRIINKTILE
jgi:hypothetical protein